MKSTGLIFLFFLLSFDAMASDSLMCPGHYDSSLAMTVYDFVDIDPSFPGGGSALIGFISKNFVYPEIVREMMILSKLYIHFVVTASGELLNIHLANEESPASDLLEAEVIRVIKLMPAWIPGKCNGVVVPVEYMIPLQVCFRE